MKHSFFGLGAKERVPDGATADGAALRAVLTRTSLRLRIVTVLLTVSLIPLFLLGIGSWVVFGRLLEQKSLELQESIVDGHARAIDSYLSERKNTLRLLADTHRLKEFANQNTLSKHLGTLNRATGGGFVDLGVIGANGDHLAYAGPYDLLRFNYAATEWFAEVTSRGEHISDVFLGFRNVPHCIIAIRSIEADERWILRATINSDQFDDLVRTTTLGATGEAFIVNRAGYYQTTARNGRLLEPSPIRPLPPARELLPERVIGDSGVEVFRVTRWINQERWLLVVQQDASEVRAPLNRAIALGALNFVFAVAAIALATLWATRHLTNRIDRADREREEMFRAFLRSAKLASIGELATGLAHEINNPLAIISADQTNIGDVAAMLDPTQESTNEILESVERSKRQIQRCKSITTKILQFGRSTDTQQLTSTQIGRSLKETASLLKRQASVDNVELSVRIDEALPSVLINELELEQVIVNLVNNSLYALPNGGRIDIIARRSGQEVVTEVVDNGSGIAPEDLERIFEPFFTTKPPGKGTGLGLPVCYGIVRSWGGRIEAESTPGRGTTVRICIPVPDESNPVGSSEGTHEQAIR